MKLSRLFLPVIFCPAQSFWRLAPTIAKEGIHSEKRRRENHHCRLLLILLLSETEREGKRLAHLVHFWKKKRSIKESGAAASSAARRSRRSDERATATLRGLFTVAWCRLFLFSRPTVRPSTRPLIHNHSGTCSSTVHYYQYRSASMCVRCRCRCVLSFSSLFGFVVFCLNRRRLPDGRTGERTDDATKRKEVQNSTADEISESMRGEGNRKNVCTEE